MFETPKAKQEFMLAAKAGRLTPPQLAAANAELANFGDAALDDLLACVNQPNPALKKFAMTALAIHQSPERFEKLFEGYLRERAPEPENDWIALLAALKGEGVTTQIAKAINQKNLETRKKALKLLIKLPDWPRQRDLVTALMDDPNAAIAETMIRQVASKALSNYAGFLRHYAAHEMPQVRDICLQALVSQKSLKNAEVFVQRAPFENEGLRKMLEAALAAFMRESPAAVMEPLIQGIASDLPEVRRFAMSLFLHLPNRAEAFARFLSFAAGTSSFVRDQMYQEAVAHADYFAELTLELVPQNQDPALRLQAIHLAQALKHPKLAPLFLHELKNPDWLIRYTAVRVLSDMKSPQALAPIVEMMNDPMTATAAIQALDKYRDIRLAKPFFQKLPNGNESEQIELLKALQNLADPRFVPHLSAFVDSTAPKGKAKKFGAEVTITICKQSNTQAPARILEINDQLSEKTIEDLPDLGLRLGD